MKAEFEITLKIKIIHTVDNLRDIYEMKSATEMEQDLIGMICDEATTAGGIAVVESLGSKVDIK